MLLYLYSKRGQACVIIFIEKEEEEEEEDSRPHPFIFLNQGGISNIAPSTFSIGVEIIFRISRLPSTW